MRRAVNLMGWREVRRRKCLRFWLLMFIASGLVSFTFWSAQYLTNSLDTRLYHVYLKEEKYLVKQFDVQEKRHQEEQLRLQQQRQHEQQQAQTRQWQPQLLALAENIPDSAWLTQLRWQNGTLTLSGFSGQLLAISTLHESLKILPGFHSVVPGATRRSEQGYWMFSYQVKRAETDDQPH